MNKELQDCLAQLIKAMYDGKCSPLCKATRALHSTEEGGIEKNLVKGKVTMPKAGKVKGLL